MARKKKTITKEYKVRVSTNALQNIDEITGYIAFIGLQPANAIKVGDEIFKVIEKIGQHPYAYKECEEIATATKIYRRAICLSWRIIYKIDAAEITVLGIIHKSRKPSAIKPLRKIK